MTNSSKFKVGLIGAGHIGRFHTRHLSQHEDWDCVGIFDTDSDRSELIAEEFGVPVAQDHRALMDASDALFITCPTKFHYTYAQEAIALGKHVFIEKPITLALDEAEKLVVQAEKADVKIQVGHVERFNPALAALNGIDLDPRFIEAHRLVSFVPRGIDNPVVHENMIHDIDIMLWTIKSKVSKIDANGVSIITETPDIANARITFENGAVANLTASRISANPMRKMRLFQQGAYISIDFGRQDVEVFRIIDEVSDKPDMLPATMLGTIEAGLKDKKIVYEKPVIPQLNAIAEEQKAFVKSIMDNQPVLVGAEEASEALRIAEVISARIVG
ncbi:MAG: Gfo/Idh/MocA family oxidoreductase [Candidatus Marinimicrobia bacterium]|nr:Gfo/Idh/MocA family oxidoreductase [Candidatus Neomarinimicrobiota bacterium]